LTSKKTEKRARIGRGLMKAGAILAVAALFVWGLSSLITKDALDQLKHSLDLWSLIALVVIINIVAFVCFLAILAAYNWIRRDFGRKDDSGKISVYDEDVT